MTQSDPTRSTPQPIELSATQAAELIHRELQKATDSLAASDPDRAIDALVRALGLALQLGPAPMEQALRSTIDAGIHLSEAQDTDALSALGPALVGLVARVRDAGALPATPTMDAWATVASDIGALIGQAGLVLTLPPERRARMLGHGRAQAQLLDDATGGIFALTPWLEQLARSSLQQLRDSGLPG